VALGVAAENTRVDGVATLASIAYWRRERSGLPQGLLGLARSLGLVGSEFALADHEAEAWWAEFETNRAEWTVALMGGRPLLLVHGSDDVLVPPSDAKILFAAANEPKELLIIDGAGHQLRLDPRAINAVLEWLERAVKRPPVRLATDGPNGTDG
ncbi:MAG: alpha/beta hydrolase, partial [Actinomycetota bacterium]